MLLAQPRDQSHEPCVSADWLQKRIACEPWVTGKADADGLVQPPKRLHSVTQLRVCGAETVGDVVIDHALADAARQLASFRFVTGGGEDTRQSGARTSIVCLAPA